MQLGKADLNPSAHEKSLGNRFANSFPPHLVVAQGSVMGTLGSVGVREHDAQVEAQVVHPGRDVGGV